MNFTGDLFTQNILEERTNQLTFDRLPESIKGKVFGKDIVHKHESDKEGQEFIDRNRKKLNAEAVKVLELMKQGHRLNNMECILNGITGSISSRVSELRKHGIDVKKEWNEAKTFKEYYLERSEIERIESVNKAA